VCESRPALLPLNECEWSSVVSTLYQIRSTLCRERERSCDASSSLAWSRAPSGGGEGRWAPGWVCGRTLRYVCTCCRPAVLQPEEAATMCRGSEAGAVSGGIWDTTGDGVRRAPPTRSHRRIPPYRHIRSLYTAYRRVASVLSILALSDYLRRRRAPAVELL